MRVFPMECCLKRTCRRLPPPTHIDSCVYVGLDVPDDCRCLRQLGPIAFGLNLVHPGLLGFVVGLSIPALIVMIAGFSLERYMWAAAGTAALFAAVVVFAIILLPAFRGVRREPPYYCLLAAILYFVSAGLLGFWMGLAKGFDVALPAQE